MISIGIGNNIDYDELECIEGDNHPSSHIFDVEDYDDLILLKDSVIAFLSNPHNNARYQQITK